MRARFYSAVSSLMSGLMSGLIVLGLAGNPSVVLSQESGAAPADTSGAPPDTQDPPDASASAPAGTLVRPDAAKPSDQSDARAASKANVNPARRSRASAGSTRGSKNWGRRSF